MNTIVIEYIFFYQLFVFFIICMPKEVKQLSIVKRFCKYVVVFFNKNLVIKLYIFKFI